MHMLSICCIYTYNRFNSYFIKLVNLKLYNYNCLEKTIIRRMEKHFIKHLNVVALDTASMFMRIYSAYNRVELESINDLRKRSSHPY